MVWLRTSRLRRIVVQAACAAQMIQPHRLMSRAFVNYAHPSWNTNRPVECWYYNDSAAVSKFVPLKDLQNEISSASLDKELTAGAKAELHSTQIKPISRWFLFSSRDEATSAVLLKEFEIIIPPRNVGVQSRARVDFILGSTRRTDHLLLSVQDLRLQEHERDGDYGDVDDITWIQVS
jgi:hypothetical protein